tara:strand:+ start:153 stop:902 length:750 start_codon:yes stop_codon:yes gene_type:complete
MKKLLITLFFSLVLSKVTFAESYYFKNCQFSEISSGDYIIDLENNLIEVNLKLVDGTSQVLVDKIKHVTKDQVVSEFIQSSKGKDSFFQYYLDAKSKSIIKLKYKKKDGALGIDGPKIQSYCTNVKSDWDKSKKESEEEKKQKEFEKEQEKERIKAKKKKEAELKRMEKEKNYRKISINDDKWYKLSEASDVDEEYLKNLFFKEASDICADKNFDVIEQNIQVREIDETPAFGTETVVKFGMKGVVECK